LLIEDLPRNCTQSHILRKNTKTEN